MESILYIDDNVCARREVARAFLELPLQQWATCTWKNVRDQTLAHDTLVFAKLTCIPFLPKQQKVILLELCEQHRTLLLVHPKAKRYTDFLLKFSCVDIKYNLSSLSPNKLRAYI